MLTTPDLTWLLLAVVAGLGSAFVWMLWEMERMRPTTHRDSDRRFG